MYGSAVFCIRTWIFAGAVRDSVGKADFRALEFCPALYGFGAIPAHGMPFTAYGNIVIIDGKILFIDGWPSPVGIQANERHNAVVMAVFIERHCMMGGVKEKFCYVCYRQELIHRMPAIKEADGVMPGSRFKEWGDGQVVHRIRCSERVQVIVEIIVFPVGIPSGVAVGLAVDTVTFTVPYSFFQTVKGALFSFLCVGVNRHAVPGNGKMHEVNEAVPVRFQQKKLFEYLEKPEAGFHILWRFQLKFFKELLNGDFSTGGIFPLFFFGF